MVPAPIPSSNSPHHTQHPPHPQGPGGHSTKHRQAHDTGPCPQGAHSLLGATDSERNNHRLTACWWLRQREEQGTQGSTEAKAREIREGFLEETPLEPGVEGRVGVRQVKKGGKGVPGRGNVAPLLPPPHANKDLRARCAGTVSLFSTARTSNVPAAAGSGGPPTAGKVLKDKNKHQKPQTHRIRTVARRLQCPPGQEGEPQGARGAAVPARSPGVRPATPRCVALASPSPEPWPPC